MDTVTIFSSLNWIMLTQLDKYFFSNCSKRLSLALQFASLSAEHGNFSNTGILQYSAVTCLRCRGSFNCQFTTESVSKIIQLVNIWQSYRQEYASSLFNSRCTVLSHSTSCILIL